MAECEREIEVRGLTGESITVSIPPDKTIVDLNLLLKQIFPPASTSPNFHLFLKGVKLNLQSQISSHSIGDGEFIVLVPYTNKGRQQVQQCEQSSVPLKESNQSSASKFADSAWSDMMQDLCSLQNISTNEDQSHIESEISNADDRNARAMSSPVSCSSETKRKRGFNCSKQDELVDELMLSLLGSSGNIELDEQNCEVFIRVLELMNCLSDPQSGICVLREANLQDNDTNKDSLCVCPSWMKTIIKAFSFLNIYSALLQFQQEKITLTVLKEALEQLSKRGLEVGVSDLEFLSSLCPKVVHVVRDEKEGMKLHNAVVIINSSTEQHDQVETKSSTAKKRVSISKIVNLMKKREHTFRSNVSTTIKLFKSKYGFEMAKVFSLEDLRVYVNDGGTAAHGNEAKRARRSSTAASSSHSFEAHCHDTNPLLPMEMVEHLRRGIGSHGQVVHVEDISARKANYVKIPDELSENTKAALKCIGVTKLYSHQAESIQGSLSGRNVVVATMTSSGKSLCYNVPVLEVLSQNLSACSLYLFPTKALAQDQLRALLAMTKGFCENLNIGVYDGDTSQADRMWLRDNTRLLITNPDMLHMSILPFHGQFRRILSNLRFVVIDEAHTYKGAFGCHTALILRRLRRLCSHVYGSDPSFIFCTATSANPSDHAMELANLRTTELIQNDGSPSGPKLFVLWNPPLCLKTVSKRFASSMDANKFAGKNIISERSSPILEISCLFAEIVQHGLRCIAFCKTRKLCELVLCYTREILQETAPHLLNSICAYRAGYIAEDRRRIESELFGGKLCGVAATNALELGIDVGYVDVTLHLGFPGSIASMWQQAGRSGRRGKPSLAVYVAFEGPLDQYFMKFPQKLFRSPIECCHVDAQNQQVLEQHLVCAALEHPLSLLHDENYFGSGIENAVMSLKDKGYLSFDPSRDSSARIWSYIGYEKMPSQGISIRAIESERYKVIDKQQNKLLEEIEESKAFFQVYEGAVYMNQGKTYLVKDLDISGKIALCQEADLKYYTKIRDYTDIHVIGGDIAYPARTSSTQYSRTTAEANTCKVTTTWFGFRRIWRGSNIVFDTVELTLPSFSYVSQAVWIRVPQSIKTAVEIKKLSFRAGLHAAGHALLNVLPLYIICNSSDVASECVNPHDTRFVPERILLYDQHPGGTGISVQVRPLFTEMLTAALELLTSCLCLGDAGCPNCVQSLRCHEYNEVLHKDAAIMIIKGVLEVEKSYFGGASNYTEAS